MKRLILAACGLTVISMGCKEKAPNIIFTEPPYKDEVSTVSAPSPADRIVLVEEFTGQSCSNCPAAHTQLEAIAAAHPNRLNIIALYQNDQSSVNVPPHGAKYDFRTNTSIDIAKYVTGSMVGQLPNAFIDRTQLASSYIIGTSAWSSAVDAQLAKKDSVNLEVSSTYDAPSNTAKIVVTVTYTHNVSTKQDLHVALLESNMVDKQETSFGAIIDDYDFKDVLREMVSSAPAGDAILDLVPTKAAGTQLIRTYTYKLQTHTPEMVPANCSIVAYVTSRVDKHVLQSDHTKLIQ